MMGGAATLKEITTQLFKKDNNNAWISQGAATVASVNGNIWTNLRYTQLADGEYKVTATLKYDQTNPVPANANPQEIENIWTVIRPCGHGWGNPGDLGYRSRIMMEATWTNARKF